MSWKYQAPGYQPAGGGTSGMDLQRSKQIAALRRLQNCREVSSTEFEAELEVKTKEQYKLLIRLSPSFPMSAPEIRVSPPCASPFIDAQASKLPIHQIDSVHIGRHGTTLI
eukprot:m.40654 g.40654  ORF g.40654 m.40654 type:complete len:111 (-) comp13977_c0_seq2:1370-1702(-)